MAMHPDTLRSTVPDKIGQRAGKLHSRGPAAYHHKVKRPLLVGFAHARQAGQLEVLADAASETNLRRRGSGQVAEALTGCRAALVWSTNA